MSKSVFKIPLTQKGSAGIDIRTLVKGLTSDICNVMYEPDLVGISKIKRKHYMVVTSAGNALPVWEDNTVIPNPSILSLNSVGVIP